MRPAREITKEEENFRLEERSGWAVIKRDPVEPEPVGTIVMKAFRVIGYDQDCDGSLMARLYNIDFDGEETGWDTRNVTLHHNSTVVVTPEELTKLKVDQQLRRKIVYHDVEKYYKD